MIFSLGFRRSPRRRLRQSRRSSWRTHSKRPPWTRLATGRAPPSSTRQETPSNSRTARRSIGTSKPAAPPSSGRGRKPSAPAPTPNIPRPRCFASASPAAMARSRPGSRDPIPEAVLAAAADPRCRWVAHNAAFERAILECILIPRHGWPAVPVDRHVCTMSLALAHAYPGSLEGVAEVLGLVNRKDTAREKIVRVMWKPRKPRRGRRPGQDPLGGFAGTAGAAVRLQPAGRRHRARAASTSAAAGACRRRSRTCG